MKKFSEILQPKIIEEQKFTSIEEQIFQDMGSRIRGAAQTALTGAKVAAIAAAPIVGGLYLGNKLLSRPSTPVQSAPQTEMRPQEQPAAAPATTAPKLKAPTTSDDETKAKPKVKTKAELDHERQTQFIHTLFRGEHRGSNAEKEMVKHPDSYSAKSYIRTGGNATAWGPGQITGTLAKEALKHKDLVAGLEPHLNDMIGQANMFKSHLRGTSDDSRYGPRGTGHLFPHGDDEAGLKYHNEVYMPVMHAMVKVKIREMMGKKNEHQFDWSNRDHVNRLAERWRGHDLEPAYHKILNDTMFPSKK
jgi:hypothetical protein